MITIILYVNKSENNQIGKTLTSYASIEGKLLESTSILNPTITIQYNGFPNCNYAYIPEFNRYYFITDIVNIRDNIWSIVMKVDVLESYKTQIKQQNAIIERQETNYNLYLQDTELPIESDSDVITRKFNNGVSFDNFNYIIMLNKGVSNKV